MCEQNSNNDCNSVNLPNLQQKKVVRSGVVGLVRQCHYAITNKVRVKNERILCVPNIAVNLLPKI